MQFANQYIDFYSSGRRTPRCRGGLGHAAADEVAQDGGVVNEGQGAHLLGVAALDVGVVLEIVLRVVDGRVVRAAEGRPHTLDRRAAGRVAALPLAEGRVVLVVPDDVGAEGGPQVWVLVVVALDVERLVAAAALGHAAVNEVLEAFSLSLLAHLATSGLFFK